MRDGVASIFLEVELLGDKRKAAITEHRRRTEWAGFIREMGEEQYADAEKIVFVMHNLNTHKTASLYHTFSPEVAGRLASRLEIHYTPKHGSWLAIAEIESSVLKRQCLVEHIPDIEIMRSSGSGCSFPAYSLLLGVIRPGNFTDSHVPFDHLSSLGKMGRMQDICIPDLCCFLSRSDNNIQGQSFR